MAVDGSAQLRQIAMALKAAGATELRRAMQKGLRAGAAPLIPAVKNAAREKLPKAGGLNEHVAKQTVRISIRTGARTAGVRLTTSAPDTAQTDAGYVRHPVFGHRDRWVTEAISQSSGWWSQTLSDKAPDVAPVLLAELARVAEMIRRGL